MGKEEGRRLCLKDEFGINTPDFEPLKESILSHFQGKDWIGIEEIHEYVSSDATDYHSGQFKKVLRELEQNGQIQVDKNTRVRRLQYPIGTKLRIK